MNTKGKIFTMVAVMGLSTVIVGGIGFYAITQGEALEQELSQVDKEKFLTERLNRYVTAVVMESRGAYMAKDATSAKAAADGILANLEKLDETLTAVQQVMQDEDLVDEFATIASEVEEFEKFRTETARLAVEVGPEAANLQGNNEANRANRSALQVALDEAVEHLEGEHVAKEAEFLAMSETLRWIIPIATLLMLAFSIGVATWIGRSLIGSVNRSSS